MLTQHSFRWIFACLLMGCGALLASLPSARDSGYSDEELQQLWASIADINHPTLEDYRRIEHYIREGNRPYLADLYIYPSRIKIIRNLVLIGSDDKMPYTEKHSFNIDAKTNRRCILLYASSNGIYPQKARNILSELEKAGYSGNVLVQIGGFPNTEFGGIKLCHVPYAFKVAFLREAQLLGYKEILWLDTAIHPLTNLEMVFEQIANKGWFLTSVSSLTGNASAHYPNAAQSLGITRDLYDEIPHISSAIIGLNMENHQAVRLLEDWLKQTERVYPNINGFPEELSLSVTAWRAKCVPYSWFGTITCAQSELPWILQERPTLQFYLDAIR